MADVNVFLFYASAKKEQRTLGELKKHFKNLVLEPQQGYFALNASTEDPLALARAGKKYQFNISTNKSQLVELRFKKKCEMFQFLISAEGRRLKVLALDQRQIVDKSKDAISASPVEEAGSDFRGGVDKKEPYSGADDQNNTVDMKREEGVMESIRFTSLLEEEIKDLRTELEVKDGVIERQRIQNKKMEQKYFQLRDTLKKVGFVVTRNNNEQLV